jgi:alcohol dehydrogenase
MYLSLVLHHRHRNRWRPSHLPAIARGFKYDPPNEMAIRNFAPPARRTTAAIGRDNQPTPGARRSGAFHIVSTWFSNRPGRHIVTTIRSAQVLSPRGPLTVVDRALPEPGPGDVRVAVQACGICHSDSLFVDGQWPGVQFPVTPGHEIAGYIDAIGDGVQHWRPGDRVAIGWSGGYCGACRNCRSGDFVLCEDSTVTGATTPGGYADCVLAKATALARIPDGLSAVDAAPMACAGVTMFNSLRHTGAGPGDLVAILGIGGLGHLGIQFAVKMGFRTVAIARGAEKGVLARELGAHHYIDSTTSDVATELKKLGGARVIQATATNSEVISAAAAGLGPHGELITLAAVPDPVHVSPIHLISISGTVHGHPGGASPDVEDTLNFAALQGIKPMVEVLPLERAAEGYQRMLANEARFRVVVTTTN